MLSIAKQKINNFSVNNSVQKVINEENILKINRISKLRERKKESNKERKKENVYYIYILYKYYLLIKDFKKEKKTSKEKKESRARIIFAHWQKIMNHPRAHFCNKRRYKINQALKKYTLPELCDAVTGCFYSPFHQGDNRQGVVYDDIELILRDSRHIEMFCRYAANPPRSLTKSEMQMRENHAVAQAWLGGAR